MGIFRKLGEDAGLPVQDFAVRSDAGCGSTIGPMTAAATGMRVCDVGSPQYSMHSAREMMGSDDVVFGYRHLKAVFEQFPILDAKIRGGGGGGGGGGSDAATGSRQKRARHS